jgi:hypothetical protein
MEFTPKGDVTKRRTQNRGRAISKRDVTKQLEGQDDIGPRLDADAAIASIIY